MSNRAEAPTFIFSCPGCGEPTAMTREDEVDIHSGAVYTCESCDGRVVFEALTVEEYAEHSGLPPDDYLLRLWRDFTREHADALFDPRTAGEWHTDNPCTMITFSCWLATELSESQGSMDENEQAEAGLSALRSAYVKARLWIEEAAEREEA